MSTLWTFAFLLHFFVCFQHVYPDTKGCNCEEPVILPLGPLVVDGALTCNELQSLPRDIFEGGDKYCEGRILHINITANPVRLSDENFNKPSIQYQSMKFTEMCINKISSGFFGQFIASPGLNTVEMRDINCLITLEPLTFTNLPKLNIIRIVKSDLTTIKTKAFNNLESLGELKIVSTRLRYLPDVLVTGKTKLTEIILSRNQIQDIPETFFNIDISSKDPIKIDLTNNSLRTLPKRLFHNLRMSSLSLEGNQLIQLSIELNSFTFRHIELLSLRRNRLTELDANFLKNLSSSRSKNRPIFDLDLTDNKWKCTCPSKWIVAVPKLSKTDVRCSSPARLKGSTIINLSQEQLCPPNKAGTVMGAGKGYAVVTDSPMADTKSDKGSKSASIEGEGPPSQEIIAIGVAVTVIVIGLITVFLLYRFRNKICPKSKASKGKMNAHYQPANTKETENGNGYNGDPIAREVYVVA